MEESVLVPLLFGAHAHQDTLERFVKEVSSVLFLKQEKKNHNNK